jgi:hypothetical protein
MAYFKTDYQALAHHWVYNSDESHCYSNRMFSEHDIIYSYGRHFPIAKRFYINDEEIYLINSDSYSVTTSKQQWAVKRAIPDNKIKFSVPEVNIYNTDLFHPHEPNINYYLTEIELYVFKESKARKYDYKPEIRRLLRKFQQYVEIFKLDKRKFTKTLKILLNYDSESDLSNLIELLTGIRNERIRLAKKKQKHLIKLSIQREKEIIEEWLNYERDRIWLNHNNKNYLRISKDNKYIEVSNGSNLTVEEGLKLINKVKRKEKILGGKVGNYNIVRFNDVFQAGCTILEKDEMNKICRQLGEEEVF